MCSGVVNDQIKKGFMLSPPVKKKIKISEYLAKLQQKDRRLVHFFVPVHNTGKRRRKCTTQSTLLPITMPSICQFKKSLTDLAINLC